MGWPAAATPHRPTLGWYWLECLAGLAQARGERAARPSAGDESSGGVAYANRSSASMRAAMSAPGTW